MKNFISVACGTGVNIAGLNFANISLMPSQATVDELYKMAASLIVAIATQYAINRWTSKKPGNDA